MQRNDEEEEENAQPREDNEEVQYLTAFTIVAPCDPLYCTGKALSVGCLLCVCLCFPSFFVCLLFVFSAVS